MQDAVQDGMHCCTALVHLHSLQQADWEESHGGVNNKGRHADRQRSLPILSSDKHIDAVAVASTHYFMKVRNVCMEFSLNTYVDILPMATASANDAPCKQPCKKF